MLLKAALVQGRQAVFDKDTGRSIGFSKCLNLATQPPIRLSVEEAGTLRVVDEMRDNEQHWFTTVDEGLLYLYVRAAATLFDDLLVRVFGDRLAEHLPLRVMPVGTEPPQEFQTLVDREYSKIAELLMPGRRARAEAEARIRSLLAMEAQVNPDAAVSDADVRRVVKGIQSGKSRGAVFPELADVASATTGTGLAVEVRFVKKGGLPVRFVGADEQVDAAAIREVPLQKKFHRGAFDLADSLKLSRPRAKALREHLGIDQDPSCHYRFTFGSQKHDRYSDNALTKMRDALAAGIDMDLIWHAHTPNRKAADRPLCQIQGCSLMAPQAGGRSAA
jgi:hypothetical protein